MKIYLICESFKLGGVQSFYLRLAKTNLDEFVLVSLTDLYDEQFLHELEEAEVSYFFASKLFLLPLRLKRATHINIIPFNNNKMLNKFPDEELYVHVSSLSGAVFATRLSQYKKIKLNIGIYNSLIFGWKSGRSSYYEYLSSALLDDFFGKDSVLFTNEQSKSHYEKLLGKKLNGRLMPVGVEMPNTTFPLPKVKNSDKFTIITIGRLIEYKTYNKHLINVINKIVPKCKRTIELHIYGNGDYLKKLKVLASNSNFDIEFRGNIKYSNIGEAFKSADCFVGCGTTLIEAASYGLPCIIGIEGIEQPLTYGFFSSTKGLSFHEQGLDYSLLTIESCIEKLLTLPQENIDELSKKHIERASDFSLKSSYFELIENFECQDYYDSSTCKLEILKLNISILCEQLISLTNPSSAYNSRYLNIEK